MRVRLASAGDAATLAEQLHTVVQETLVVRTCPACAAGRRADAPRQARAAEGLPVDTLAALRRALGCLSVRGAAGRESGKAGRL